jgi:hypothetical protein
VPFDRLHDVISPCVQKRSLLLYTMSDLEAEIDLSIVMFSVWAWNAAVVFPAAGRWSSELTSKLLTLDVSIHSCGLMDIEDSLALRKACKRNSHVTVSTLT